jgi:hypothetical protein
MKNLDERIQANGVLWCPYTGANEDDTAACVTSLCAHYNLNTRECVHVETAQAQKTIAAVLALICSGRVKLNGTFRKIDEEDAP